MSIFKHRRKGGASASGSYPVITGSTGVVGQAGTFTYHLPPLSGWTAGKALLVKNGSATETAQTLALGSGTVSLTPTGVAGDTYRARLLATVGGVDVAVAETDAWTLAAPIVIPGQVLGLTVGAVTSSSVALSWTAPASGSAVTSYRVEYQPAGGSWVVFNDGVTTGTSTVVTGLSPGTGYSFRVSGSNAAGTGPTSVTATATTISEAAASNIAQVTGLSVYSSTPESVTLTWTRPAGMPTSPNNDGSYIGTRQQGDYLVEYRPAGGVWTEWVKYPVASHEDSTFEALVGLTPGQTYEFRVTGRKVTVYRPNINTLAVVQSVDDAGPASSVLSYTMPVVPAAPSLATFAATAQKIRTAKDTISIVDDAADAVPSLTALATLNASDPATLSPINGLSSPKVSASAMPVGPTGQLGKAWVLGNRRTAAANFVGLRSSQGGSYRFQFNGQKFDFTASTSGGLTFRVRYSEDGGTTYRWVKDAIKLTANTGTHYIVCDFGSAKSRIVEVHGEAAAIIGGFNFDTSPTTSTPPAAAPVPSTMPKMAMWVDSYVYGQGDGVDFTKCFCAETGRNLGTVSMYNHGFQTNPWGKRGAAVDAQPWIPERMSNPKMAATYPGATGEIDVFGALDVVFLCATINDNASSTSPELVTRLYHAAVAAFRYARQKQPNALIVFTTTLFDPSSIPGATVVDAYRNAFSYALGDDPGAVMLDAVAEGWSATARPTAHYPETGDTIHPSPAGHLYYGSKIAAGALALVDRVLAGSGPAPTTDTLRVTSSGDTRITSNGDTRSVS